MSEFIDLIKEVLEKSGLNKTQFAKRIGIERSNFLGVLAGTKFLTREHLVKVSEISGVELEYLIGLQERWRLSIQPEKVQKVIDIAKKLPPEDQGELVREIVLNHPDRERLLMDMFKQPLGISCQKCGENLGVTLERLGAEAQPEFTCATCGTVTVVNTKDQAKIQESQKAVDSLRATLKTLGKKR